MAQRPVLRMSDDRGKTYPARLQRPLDRGVYAGRRPARPCAVPTYGADGLTRCVAIDLDPGRGDVERDADLIEVRVRAAGGHLIADRSPTGGGRHLYLLLAEGVGVDHVLQVLHGWRRDCPTLDPAPMRSAAAGLIAPPGAVHKSGRGDRQLTTPWPDVQALIDSPNPSAVWERLVAAAPPLPAGDRTVATDVETGLAEAVDPLTHGMADRYVAIARTGDSSAYRSPSEARQAVLWAAAAAGLALADVVRRIETGAWPGLAALFSRYSPAHRRGSLARDWRKAIVLVEKQRTLDPRMRSDRQNNTRGPATHPPPPLHEPSGYASIRDWDNVLAHVEQHHLQDQPAQILVLRAMGQAAQRRGEPIVQDGLRAISLATHLDISTISRALAELRDAPSSLIVRTVDAANRWAAAPDTYELVIPDSLQNLVRQRWRRGQLRALHPAFRELGRVAGFVYEAVARAGRPLQVLDLIEQVPYTKSAIDEALATLATYHLVDATRDGRRTLWRIGHAGLDQVAALLGADLVHRTLVHRYHLEREAFRALLIDWAAQRATGRFREPPDPDPPPEPNPPGPQELLITLLGATHLASMAKPI